MLTTFYNFPKPTLLYKKNTYTHANTRTYTKTHTHTNTHIYLNKHTNTNKHNQSVYQPPTHSARHPHQTRETEHHQKVENSSNPPKISRQVHMDEPARV